MTEMLSDAEREARIEELRATIRKCDEAIEAGTYDSWHKIDRDRARQELDDLLDAGVWAMRWLPTQGGTFASFSALQKAAQATEREARELVTKHRKRYPRIAKAAREAFGNPLDHDHSMNG